MKVPEKIDTARMVMSPMPGAIVSISVKEGQTVVDGQDLCVIEAMKMQNEVRSHGAGRISAIRVSVGDTVASGQVLVTLE